MISIIRIFLFITIFLLAGCTKNEFRLEFDIDDKLNANYKISYYASDKRGGIMIESVAPIANGKASVKGITRNPALVYVFNNSSEPAAVIYVERGETVMITGSGSNPAQWTVGGNEINAEWSNWRNSNAEIIASGKPAEINKAVEKFVDSHTSDPLSTLLMLTSFSRRDNEQLFLDLWRKLDKNARDVKWIELAARAEQTEPYAIAPGPLHSMALRSLHNGVDTIRPSSAKGTLLFFWNSGQSSRKEAIDSLRKLAKEYPDSASRIIADICLEADSISWKSPLRSDSLKNVARMWVPAGMADRRMMTLGVKRSPFFIVTNRKGDQKYRGSEISEAFSAFRTIVKADTVKAGR